MNREKSNNILSLMENISEQHLTAIQRKKAMSALKSLPAEVRLETVTQNLKLVSSLTFFVLCVEQVMFS